MDIVDRGTRSRMMSGIRGKNTRPERMVRSYLHRQGLRYTLHRRHLPGKPDIVLPRWQTVVLVHGCFWHRHPGCRYAYQPKSNRAFWTRKFRENTNRDRRNISDLRKLGWQVLVVWECQSASERVLRKLVARIRGERSK